MDDCGFLTGADLETFWDFFDEDIFEQDNELIEQIAAVQTEVNQIFTRLTLKSHLANYGLNQSSFCIFMLKILQVELHE